ncbi:MAG: MlaD family protein [Synechococcales bacterium]|nr:MlaD family protein [Synechococcales bacterium]
MRSRMVREGSVGLLILGSLGLFGGLMLWLQGLNPANRSFSVIVDFASVSGIQVGSPVRYQGVPVGRVTEIRPSAKGVEVKVSIAPADLIIPKGAEVSINQASFLGESSVDITSPKSDVTMAIAAKPLDGNCDKATILCDGSRLSGQPGISTEELIRSTIEFTRTYSHPEFVTNLNQLTRNSSLAAGEIAKLSREMRSVAKTAQQELSTVSRTANVTAENFAGTARALSSTADKASLTLTEVNGLLINNRGTLVTTLDNLNATSGSLRATMTKLSPALDRVTSGQLIQNLETLSANAALASANLKDASKALNNPANLVLLQQTLDSARATFQNTQKLTSDLDELVGDPKLRNNLRNLINGLSGLVSSTNQLQQQAQVAQVLEPLAQTAKTTGKVKVAKPIVEVLQARLSQPPSSQPAPSAPVQTSDRPSNQPTQDPVPPPQILAPSPQPADDRHQETPTNQTEP